MANEGRSKSGPISAALLLAISATIALSTFLGSLISSAYRAVDILRLIGIGMCFGVALALIFTTLRGSKFS